MITMHARPRRTDRRTNIMEIAQRFVLANASRAKKERQYTNEQNQTKQDRRRQWKKNYAT